MALKEFVAFAETLADASAEIIRPYFRSDIGVEYKDDDSPVTVADKEAESVMRKLIEDVYPEHGILGEEEGYKNEDAEYCWTLDPIDGTISFIAGRPIFGTLIGLLHKGKPILGVLNQPIIGERWVGSALGAYLNGEACKVRDCKKLDDATICTSGPQYFSDIAQLAYLTTSERARYQVYGGDCYNYGLLAAGHVDLVVEAGLKPHDYVPLVALVEAAGGICTDWEGNDVTLEGDGDVIAATNKVLANDVRELLHSQMEDGDMLFNEFEQILLAESDD